MKSSQAIHTMTNLYEMLVDRRYSKNKDVFTRNQGIMFQVDILSICHGFELDGNTHHPEWEEQCNVTLYVIILSGHKVFTKVAAPVGFDCHHSILGEWTNTSNHESGWRHGVDELTSLGFDVVDHAYRNCPEEHITQDKDARVDLRLGVGLCCSKLFKFIEVDYEDIDKRGYQKKITAIRDMKDVSIVV